MINTFISYSSKDSALAMDLAHRLQKVGLNVFTEKNATKWTKKGSRPFIDRRLDSLRASDEVVVLLTENAIADPQIGFEFGAALALRKKVTPIVVGVDTDKLPSLFKTLKSIQYAEIENYLSKLKKGSRTAAKTHKRSRAEIRI